jgi:hypothetical protein
MPSAIQSIDYHKLALFVSGMTVPWVAVLAASYGFHSLL